MTDISPLPEAAGKTTHTSLKEFWSSLPYEIALLVVDQMIEDAWTSSTAEPFVMYMDAEDLAVKGRPKKFFKLRTERAPYETHSHTMVCDSTVYRNRLRRIRTMLHINQKTRAMVEARFIRLSCSTAYNPLARKWRPCMWICLGAEVFYTKLECLSGLTIDIRRTGEMPHGSALQHIDNLRLGVRSCQSILGFFNFNIAALVKMPNIKSVTLVLETRYVQHPMYSRRPVDHHPVPADVAVCPHMAAKCQAEDVVQLWAPIWAKGIRVLVDVSDECKHHNAVGELFLRSGEFRVRLFPPKCNCYSPLPHPRRYRC